MQMEQQTVKTQIREQSDLGLPCLPRPVCPKLRITVIILNFRTDKSGQTVKTQIRLLLEGQSDQGLHCLLFHLHVFDQIPLCLNFR